jgi:hypothetical protein
LQDITFTDAPGGEKIQQARSRQVETYSCGHEVTGPRLEESAGPDSALDVERRTSDETVTPTEGDQDAGTRRRV